MLIVAHFSGAVVKRSRSRSLYLVGTNLKSLPRGRMLTVHTHKSASWHSSGVVRGEKAFL